MEDKKKDVTIYDLAAELNISPSTVSRALNDHRAIGKKTKKKVKELAEAWGYRPNTLAASLRTNRSNTIGMMVSWLDRPFISLLISGVEKAAREAGYQVLISQSYDDTELERENLQALYDSRVSALIVSQAMDTQEYDHFDLFIKNGIPVIFVDRIPHLKNIHRVHINNFQTAFEATQHLIAQGCQRIAHFGGARHQRIYEERMLGYQAALRENQLEPSSELLLMGSSLSMAEGTRLAQQVLALADPPDGIFCANDLAAVSAIRYARSRKIDIPKALAIIGFNNDPLCEIIDPPLSSVVHPAVKMGEAAISRVIDILEGRIDARQASGLILETQVVIRASSDRKGL